MGLHLLKPIEVEPGRGKALRGQRRGVEGGEKRFRHRLGRETVGMDDPGKVRSSRTDARRTCSIVCEIRGTTIACLPNDRISVTVL